MSPYIRRELSMPCYQFLDYLKYLTLAFLFFAFIFLNFYLLEKKQQQHEL